MVIVCIWGVHVVHRVEVSAAVEVLKEFGITFLKTFENLIWIQKMTAETSVEMWKMKATEVSFKK